MRHGEARFGPELTKRAGFVGGSVVPVIEGRLRVD